MATRLRNGALVAILILASGSLACRPAAPVSIEVVSSNRCLSLLHVVSGRPLTFDTALQVATEIQSRPREQSLVVAWIVSSKADLDWIMGSLLTDESERSWRMRVEEKSRESPEVARLMLFPGGGVLQYRERGGAVTVRPVSGSIAESGVLGLPGYSVAHLLTGPRAGLDPEEDRRIDVFLARSGTASALPMAKLAEVVSEKLRCGVHSLELRSDFWFRDSRLGHVYPFAGKDQPLQPPPLGKSELGWCLMVDGKLRCEDYRDAKSK